MAEPRVKTDWAVFPPTEGSDAFSISVNSPTTWRERLADRLRTVAARIDGHWSLGVAVRMQPPLDHLAQRRVIEAGLAAMVRKARVEAFPGRYRG